MKNPKLKHIKGSTELRMIFLIVQIEGAVGQGNDGSLGIAGSFVRAARNVS